MDKKIKILNDIIASHTNRFNKPDSSIKVSRNEQKLSCILTFQSFKMCVTVDETILEEKNESFFFEYTSFIDSLLLDVTTMLETGLKRMKCQKIDDLISNHLSDDFGYFLTQSEQNCNDPELKTETLKINLSI